MLRKPVPPAGHAPAIQQPEVTHGGLGTPKPKARRTKPPAVPLTGETPKPKPWPKLVRWSVVDGQPVRTWVPGFTMRTPTPAPGWAFEGSPEEAQIRKELGICR